MECARCPATLPEEARFCHLCGTDAANQDPERTMSYACRPDELVESFALMSTVMPRAAAARVRTLRLALRVALALVAVAAVAGAVPVAVVLAAVAVPAVYLVYLRDGHLWERHALRVHVVAGVTVVAAAAWTWVGLLLGGRAPGVGAPPAGAAFTVLGFLVAAVLVPVVGEVIREVGPLRLLRLPPFDDPVDALTFGLVSGMAYATGDTLVRRWALVTGPPPPGAGPASLLPILMLDAFVKPLVLGLATSLACLGFSGVGEAYDGFSDRYLRGFRDAVLASVAYFGGIYLLGFLPDAPVSAVLSLMYGLALLAVLMVRVRGVLHRGLLEGALSWSGRYAGVGRLPGPVGCGRCETPLADRSAFCGTCGAAVLGFARLYGPEAAPTGEQSSSETVGGTT